MSINEMNAAALAYIGDAVFEVEIRKYLLSTGVCKVNDLQKAAVNYVSARSQAVFLDKLLDKDFFSEDELYTISRSRNYKPKSKPKNTDIKLYKKATALEALFGKLYLENNIERIKIIMKEILGE